MDVNSEKLDFYGHQKNHPMAESYYSQHAIRYGKYIAKLGVVPATPGLQDLAFDPDTGPDSLRDARVAFFRTHAAAFDVQIQLNTGLEGMPIEDSQAKWSEEALPYRTVAASPSPRRTLSRLPARTSSMATSASRPPTPLSSTDRSAPSRAPALRPTRLFPPCAATKTTARNSNPPASITFRHKRSN